MRLVKYLYFCSNCRRECSSTDAMAACPLAMSAHCASICARTCLVVGYVWFICRLVWLVRCRCGLVVYLGRTTRRVSASSRLTDLGEDQIRVDAQVPMHQDDAVLCGLRGILVLGIRSDELEVQATGPVSQSVTTPKPIGPPMHQTGLRLNKHTPPPPPPNPPTRGGWG